MSTREIAYNIFQQLTEDELKGFIALFQRVYSVKNETSPASDEESVDMEKRRAAFMRMEKLRRPMPDLDEKKELAEYREEKYGK
jgi:hypothetical protein